MFAPQKHCPARQKLCNLENKMSYYRGMLKACAEYRAGEPLSSILAKAEKGLRDAALKAEELKIEVVAQEHK